MSLFYILNDDDESSEELFNLLNNHFNLYINNYEYLTDTDEDDDDELIEQNDYESVIEYVMNSPEPILILNNRITAVNYHYTNDVQNNSLYDEYSYKNVVTEKVYEDLKKQNLKYKDLDIVEKKENIECPISLEKFNDEDNIIKLNCGHFFHKEPILYWLYMQKNKCPLCRYEYPSINKRIE